MDAPLFFRFILRSAIIWSDSFLGNGFFEDGLLDVRILRS